MQDFPAIQAVLAGPIPDLIVGTWSELAGEHSDTGAYVAATSFERMVGVQGNPLAVVVANTSPHARVLEDGHQGFHMPSRVDWSGPKVKGKDGGRRYLVIPFRHGTPGTQGVGSGRARTMMPRDVYANARRALGLVAASDRSRAQSADKLQAAGTRLSRPYNLPEFPAALRARAVATEGQPGYTWRSRTYEGLTHTGGGYFTFRVMTEDSAGWFIPAFAGYHFADQVVTRVRGQIRDLVDDATRADVVELVRLAVGRAA
jgi:hypothetical protein